MPELLPKHVTRKLRRITLAMACALPLCSFSAGVLAQNVPAGLRACAAESDPGERLDCYDREMKRLSVSPTAAAKAGPSTSAKPEPPVPPASPMPPAQRAPDQTDLSSRPAKPTSDTAASTSAAASGVNPPPAPPHRVAPWKIFSGGASWRLTAQIVSVDRSPDAMVLHLDNGQAWRQVGRASGDLSLRAGDKVRIAEHLGSYWLSSRYVSGMKVRQEDR